MNKIDVIKNQVGKECWAICEDDLYYGVLIGYEEAIPDVLYDLRINVEGKEERFGDYQVYFTIDDAIKAGDDKYEWHRIMQDVWRETVAGLEAERYERSHNK